MPPSVQRELGEIKAQIDILASQNDKISDSLDELKESSIKCGQQVKALTNVISIYKDKQDTHCTRINNIEKGLASKVLTSVSAVVASLFAVIYAILN